MQGFTALFITAFLYSLQAQNAGCERQSKDVYAQNIPQAPVYFAGFAVDIALDCMGPAFTRAWMSIALMVLLWGVVAALTGELGNNVGWGPMWFFAAALLAFPTGTVFMVIALALLGIASTLLLGTDRYFALLAEVGVAWVAVVGGGALQGRVFRLWRARRGREPAGQ